MRSENNKTQREAFRILLRPVVRYFLRKSATIQTFHEIAKAVFIEVAAEELRAAKQKVNVSRLSLITGITRNEVTRIYKHGKRPAVRSTDSVLSRVMGQWEQHPSFSTKAKTPKVLTFQGEDSEFHRLVSSVSKHINPGSVLKELEKTKSVERTPRGLKLVKEIDRSLDEEQWRIELLADDFESQLCAVNENIVKPEKTRNVQLRTEYDNIRVDQLEEVRHWFLQESKRVHKRLRNYLSQYDLDVNPVEEDTEHQAGGKAIFSTYSLTLD